jgi:hypothetical protein
MMNTRSVIVLFFFAHFADGTGSGSGSITDVVPFRNCHHAKYMPGVRSCDQHSLCHIESKPIFKVYKLIL